MSGVVSKRWVSHIGEFWVASRPGQPPAYASSSAASRAPTKAASGAAARAAAPVGVPAGAPTQVFGRTAATSGVLHMAVRLAHCTGAGVTADDR